MTESVKRTYEGMFLVESGWASSDWEQVVATINTLMERARATVVSLRKWDDRRLCYEIKGHSRGTYVLVYFEATPQAIVGLERDAQLNESILRLLVLSAEGIPAELREADTPAMMAERYEEERGRAGRDDEREPRAERPRSEPRATAVATAPETDDAASAPSGEDENAGSGGEA